MQRIDIRSYANDAGQWTECVINGLPVLTTTEDDPWQMLMFLVKCLNIIVPSDVLYTVDDLITTFAVYGYTLNYEKEKN